MLKLQKNNEAVLQQSTARLVGSVEVVRDCLHINAKS